MYLPRSLITLFYNSLWEHYHPASPQVLILVALEPDALCACRILTALFKYDNILYKIQPISGYDDLKRAGQTMVKRMKKQEGGEGGTVICLGVGGMVDISETLQLNESNDEYTDPSGGVEVWLIDARRPWNLGNVFGGDPNVIPGEPNSQANARIRESQVEKGKILPAFKPGEGGVIVYDDGDIEEQLAEEQEAFCSLVEMEGAVDDYGLAESESEEDENILDSIEVDSPNNKKRKASTNEDDGSDEGDQRPRQRRRSNSDTSVAFDEDSVPPNGVDVPSSVQVPSSAPANGLSDRALRKQFHRERRKHQDTLGRYYAQGSTYSEPISSIMYSLAEERGKEDNDMLWQAIVGVSSLELYGRSMTGVGISTALDEGGSAGWGGERGERIRQTLRDEVNRLNPPDPYEQNKDAQRGEVSGVIPTTAKSPHDHSIRLSPEPRFLLIRHWSLYESMLHSPYLGSRLHIWSDQGRKRLHKLLAKMGVSLSQCKQSYTHMDMDLKRGLRQRLLAYAPVYGLDGLVPPKGRDKMGWGFVKCWGWKGCFSAVDVGVIVGAILEVGKHGIEAAQINGGSSYRNGSNNHREIDDPSGALESEEWVGRFWEAYDALQNVDSLKSALATAQHLHRAILRTGTSIIEKRQIRHLNRFRVAVVKEGPDVALFTHPSALTKLALWVGEAIAEQEKDQRGKIGKDGRPTPLVMASLNDIRGVYVVVGTGGGGGIIDFVARAKRKVKLQEKARKKEAKQAERDLQRQEKREARRRAAEERGSDDEEDESEEDDDDDDDDDDSDGSDDRPEDHGSNRFGNAFQEVVDETNVRVRIDSFENCVVEVKKEDLSEFLTSLSEKLVVG